MRIFDSWSPDRLEGHGDLQVSNACNLLVARRAEFTSDQLRRAQDRLVHARDFKQVLNGKRLLARIKVARLYAKKADEALHAIQGMLVS